MKRLGLHLIHGIGPVTGNVIVKLPASQGGDYALCVETDVKVFTPPTDIRSANIGRATVDVKQQEHQLSTIETASSTD